MTMKQSKNRKRLGNRDRTNGKYHKGTGLNPIADLQNHIQQRINDLSGHNK